MQIIDTFSGIGGFSLAGSWMGWRTIQFCEIDPWCHKVLKKHWPNVPIHMDINTLTPEIIKQSPLYNENEETIITGGVPCQPASTAGKRRGESDERWLWPQTIKFIGKFKPTFAVLENVAGLVSMENGKTLDRILSDLEDEGYTTEQVIIPACAVGAWHRRDRIWIIAHSNGGRNTQSKLQYTDISTGSDRCNRQIISHSRLFGSEINEEQATGVIKCGEDAPDTKNARTRKNNGGIRQGVSGVGRGEGSDNEDDANCNNQRLQGRPETGDAGGGRAKRNEQSQRCGQLFGGENRTTQRSVGRVADGLPHWVDGYWDREPEGVLRVATGVKDRVNRLKGLGNAIVPQVVYQIFKAIESHNIRELYDSSRD